MKFKAALLYCQAAKGAKASTTLIGIAGMFDYKNALTLSIITDPKGSFIIVIILQRCQGNHSFDS